MDAILTIGISTLQANLPDLLNKLKLYDKIIDKHIKFLVCAQGKEHFTQDIDHRVKVIHSTTIGLSKSRNILLENAASKFLWIQDDDIDLNVDFCNSFCENYGSQECDIFIGKIHSTESHDDYKDYSFFMTHQKLNALKISSIEIIVHVDFCKVNGLKFDPLLGLGTNLPCCEENLFLWQLFSLDAKVKYISEYICKHTTLIDSRNIDFEKRFVAKGFLLSKLPIYYSLPLFFRWAIRPSSVVFLSRVKLLVKGFLSTRG